MQKVFVYLAYLFFVFILCILNQLVMDEYELIQMELVLGHDHLKDIFTDWSISLMDGHEAFD